MTKFTGPSNQNFNRGILQTTNLPSTFTHEGGDGFTRTPRSELFLQAVSEMAEDTFYETAEQRRVRLSFTISEVLKENGGWAWVCDLVKWLRAEGNMRSASIMIAAEAIAARNSGETGTAPTARQLVSSAILRADEPAEFLGYWLEFHGRNIPAAVKRGVADSATRLYTEWNALKYDGQGKAIRFGDVIDLTHPTPTSESQSALFKHLLDRRHNRDNAVPEILDLFARDAALQNLPSEERRAAFNRADTADAGWSWERVAGWLPGGMDAEAWEGLIPSMGYMALLRNLRNFDQVGISQGAVKNVLDRLTNPEEVAKSHQFPYRFLSAYKATESMNWNAALETALGLSIQNIPEFEGRTLILVDTSGSMQSSVGGERSQAMRYEVAALFGAALAVRNAGKVDVAIYATDDQAIKAPTNGAAVLRFTDQMRKSIGSVGHGTNTHQALRNQYQGQSRVVILTDEQSHDSDRGLSGSPWIHTINLAGYRAATMSPSSKHFSYGGFGDQMFGLLPVMEAGASGKWPWNN